MSANLTQKNKVINKIDRFKLFSAKTWDGPDYDELAFDVISKDIMVGNFKIPDRKAIFRVSDSGEEVYLSTVSNSYPIIKHSDIVAKIEEGMGLAHKNISIKTILSKDGAQMQRIYTLSDYSVEIRPGDEVSPSIRIVNSYDGSTSIGFYIDAIRLICMNGMIATKQFMSMSYRHFGNRFNLNLFAQNAKKLIDGFNEYIHNWGKWTTENVSKERADLLINYMPARLRPMIVKRYDENFDGTKWGLYNAYTAAITHDYTPSRSINADAQKITLGAEVTKIFSTNWYWTAPKDAIIRDLISKRRIKEDLDNISDTVDVNGDFEG